MPLSRRQFFRRFLGPESEPSLPTAPESRESRYEVLETYVRNQLLPYDFALTEKQEQTLFEDVRKCLRETPDDELFSVFVRARVEDLVETVLHPWREENRRTLEAEKVREVRGAAEDAVNEYVNIFATPAALIALRRKFQSEDRDQLEGQLRLQIRDWVSTLDEETLLQYDLFTIKDLIFSRLRLLADDSTLT